MLFVVFLHSKSLTIKSYLAAVCFHQIARGLADPKISKILQLEYVIKGIIQSSTASSRCRSLISPAILMDQKKCGRKAITLINSSIWEASCLCFFSFLRPGDMVTPSETEFNQSTYLSLTDVKVDSHLKPS